MNSSAVLAAAAVIPYEVLMIFGMGVIGCFWASPTATPRRIPEIQFAVFGLALPCGAWLFSLFYPPVSAVLPLSFGWLYWLVNSQEAQGHAGEARMLEESLAASLRMIAEDSTNAAAYCSLAQISEKRGQHALALELYRKAHKADGRALPAAELEDLTARLEEAARAGELRKGLRPKIPHVENILFLVGLTYFFWSASFAVNLCSVMLFIRWLRGDLRPGFS